MKKIYLIVTVVIFVAVVVFAFSVFLINPDRNPSNNNTNVIWQSKGITVDSPKPNDTVSSPLKIKGSINGFGWTGFEGQVGTVELKDDATGKVLASTYLPATEDWMQLPVNFEATLWYSYQGNGSGTLVFHNENASGEPSRDKTFSVPVQLTTTSGEKTTFNVYFTNPADISQSCEVVTAFKRDVPKTQSVAKAALEELILGPTASEKNAGIITNINE